MTEEGPSVYQENDKFCADYSRNLITLTEEARSLTITNPTTGELSPLPDIVAQLKNDYMFIKEQLKLANQFIHGVDHITETLTETAGDVIARYHKAAYALHGMIEYLHLNDYLDDGVAKKLSDCTSKRVELEKKLHKNQEEIERLRSLVRLLHGNPDKTDDRMVGSVERK